MDLIRQQEEISILEAELAEFISVTPVPPTLLTLDITAKMAASVMTVVSMFALDKLMAIS